MPLLTEIIRLQKSDVFSAFVYTQPRHFDMLRNFYQYSLKRTLKINLFQKNHTI
jgi:hypothetical protein